MDFVAKNFDELTTYQLYEILRVRSQIFIVEENMHCLDLDGVDFKAKHYFLEENGKVLAYLRAYYEDNTMVTIRLGRVLSVTHGIGMGKDIMIRAIGDITENMKCQKISIDSQKHAVGFYEKLGFKTVSDEFLEEGVLHVKMELGI